MVEPNTSEMTVSAVRIAKVIGWDATIALHDELGGRERIYLPKHPYENHPIGSAIGQDNFRKLCDALGPGRLYIAKQATHSNRKGGIVDDILAGELSVAQIGAKRGVTDRYVRLVRREMRELGLASGIASNRRGRARVGWMLDAPLQSLPHHVVDTLAWSETSKKRSFVTASGTARERLSAVGITEAHALNLARLIDHIIGSDPGEQLPASQCRQIGAAIRLFGSPVAVIRAARAAYASGRASVTDTTAPAVTVPGPVAVTLGWPEGSPRYVIATTDGRSADRATAAGADEVLVREVESVLKFVLLAQDADAGRMHPAFRRKLADGTRLHGSAQAAVDVARRELRRLASGAASATDPKLSQWSIA